MFIGSYGSFEWPDLVPQEIELSPTFIGSYGSFLSVLIWSHSPPLQFPWPCHGGGEGAAEVRARQSQPLDLNHQLS